MEASSVHSSQADVWYLKDIVFASQPVKIITQNFNGPCSFIAICNILILRGQIQILPPDRTTVSYEFLSQLVGEYLLTNCPDIDISAALSIMPSTTKGLDLNPQFTSITAFSPASDVGELDLFAQAGIQLVHGWVVDPESPEAEVMAHIRDYDTAVTLIADADYLTKGKLLSGDAQGDGRAGYAEAPEASSSSAGGSASLGSFLPRTTQYSDEDRCKIEHAIVAQQFLDATQSQLTYHGLFQLASKLEPGAPIALFRNAHLSVIYKFPGGNPEPTPESVIPHPSDSDTPPTLNPDGALATPDPDPDSSPDLISNATPTQPVSQDSALYALVTDDVFLHEPSIVWERLEDVDGGSSWFVDSNFHRAVPIGGDVAGQTAEAALRQFELEAGLVGVIDPADQALAKQLQAEEDEPAREMYARRHQALERRRVEEEEARRRKESTKVSERRKKGKNCVIM
ncbi:hypothetical protein L210DRAFT_976831 [Boletus edulis BED1]|uniref:MINDY deubiquitinase domain-containing protein n=1 Tax=Boletus edulis BED1 TaxID=1328754 RepID=A0AAD4BX03_BOLED|nr:hypothetical protein L210DRAFT_976831 [Boletus edulis BED1]